MITWHSLKDIEPKMKAQPIIFREDGVQIIICHSDPVLLYSKKSGACIGCHRTIVSVNPDYTGSSEDVWYLITGGSIKPTHWSELNEPS